MSTRDGVSRWLRAVVPVILLAVPLRAQSAVVGWRLHNYDTRAYDLPVQKVAMSYLSTAVLRADGRIYQHGNGWS